MLGIDPDAQARTLYDVFVGACELPGTVQGGVAPGVDLAVGSERMADIELTLAGELMRERYLAEALAGHTDDYDLAAVGARRNRRAPGTGRHAPPPACRRERARRRPDRHALAAPPQRRTLRAARGRERGV